MTNPLAYLNYLNVALAVSSALSTVRAEIADTSEPISGKDLAADVEPVCGALELIIRKLSIPRDVVLECCEAVAAVLNRRRDKIKK